jgi:hypothetical protein
LTLLSSDTSKQYLVRKVDFQRGFRNLQQGFGRSSSLPTTSSIRQAMELELAVCAVHYTVDTYLNKQSEDANAWIHKSKRELNIL